MKKNSMDSNSNMFSKGGFLKKKRQQAKGREPGLKFPDDGNEKNHYPPLADQVTPGKWKAKDKIDGRLP